jgi:hypothetical protein
MPLSVVRLIDSRIVLPASWIISGALFGLASATVLQWSLPAAILAAGIAGTLSWLGRGVANLVLTCIAMLALIAIAVQAGHFLAPGEGWSWSWLGPCALAGVILLLLLIRRLKPRLGSWRVGALVELIAAVVSLLLALKFAADVSSAGREDASLFLLGAEDNDAWINLVGILHNAHGATVLTGSSIGALGPVVPTYLAGVRAASSGILPTALPMSLSPNVVLSAYGLLVVTAPVVAALLARGTSHLRRTIVTLLAWGCATALIISSCVVLISYGALSAALAILLVLPAVYLVSITPRLENRRTQVAWLASTLLLFGAGAAWIPLAPLAGAAIAAYCFPVLRFATKDFRRTIPVAAVLCLTAIVMELELLQQYRDVVGPIGGETPLFAAAGGTPGVTGSTQALILVLLFMIAWFSSSRTRLNSSASERGFITSLSWLVGYVVFVLLANASKTGVAPGYGSTKLQFVLAGVWVPLAVIEVVSRLATGRRQLKPAAIIVLAVLWASTVQGGPIYDAATRHWPTATAKTVWFDTVVREVDLGGRVLCLQVLTVAAPDPNALDPLTALDPYNCSRFASSAQGKDDGAASTWRNVQLGRLPVSDAVSEVEKAKDKPWRIVVIGQMAELNNPKGWWAPIVRLPGLEFVSAPG